MTQPVNSYDYNAGFGIQPQKSKSELNMEMFLRLLVTQLQNQNPLEPMNDRDFFAQMAQLGTVSGLDQVKKSMDVAQAASLIGKDVTAVRPMTETGHGLNDMVTGRVVRMQVKNGDYWLGLRESDGGIVDVRLTQVTQIHESIPGP
ncbi:MAG: flagellar hook capping FlgD N-terminal domain-containing protein [Fimbriimonadaceae bacterium]